MVMVVLRINDLSSEGSFIGLIENVLKKCQIWFQDFSDKFMLKHWSFFFVFMAIFLWGMSYFSIMYQLWFLWDQLIHKRLKLLQSFAHKCHGQIWTYIIGHACIPEIWPFLVCHLLQWIFVSYFESKLCYVEILKNALL